MPSMHEIPHNILASLGMLPTQQQINAQVLCANKARARAIAGWVGRVFWFFQPMR
jgi:hypothetical protein